MPESDDERIDRLLQRVNDGDHDARNELVERIQVELRLMARKALAGEGRRDPVMQTTLLVNEAYVKLFESRSRTTWQNRKHFFGAARRAMRQLLVDWARGRDGLKRGGGQAAVTLGDWIPQASGETTPSTALAAIAASTALPDPASTSSAASVARWWGVTATDVPVATRSVTSASEPG